MGKIMERENSIDYYEYKKMMEFTETDNGFCYKDTSAFDNQTDEICYIPEYSIDNNTEDCKAYKYSDFLELATEFINENKLNRTPHEIAEQLFHCVDWQHPDSLLYEQDLSFWEMNDE